MNANTPGSRSPGFDREDARAVATMAIGAVVLIPTAAYLLGGVHFSGEAWRPGLDIEPLRTAGLVVVTHIIAALCALALGIFVLTRRKGGRNHRWMGRAWAGLMIGAAVSGMVIDPTDLSPAHGAALIVFVMIPLAIRRIRRGDLRGHRRTVAQLLIALVIVGFLSLMPGQLLHDVFFAGTNR